MHELRRRRRTFCFNCCVRNCAILEIKDSVFKSQLQARVFIVRSQGDQFTVSLGVMSSAVS